MRGSRRGCVRLRVRSFLLYWSKNQLNLVSFLSIISTNNLCQCLSTFWLLIWLAHTIYFCPDCPWESVLSYKDLSKECDMIICLMHYFNRFRLHQLMRLSSSLSCPTCVQVWVLYITVFIKIRFIKHFYVEAAVL